MADGGGLPRILHHVWVGGSLPPPLDRFVASWKALHPGWEQRVWGDDDLDWLANRDLFDHADEFVPPDAVGQFKADVARYEILWHYGGVYADCDFEPRRPIDELCDRPFGVSSPMSGVVVNGLLGMTAGHPLMGRCVDGLAESVDANRGRKAMWLSGPRYLTRLIRPSDRLTVWPARWFFPYRWDQLDRPYSPDGCYAVHHWLHRRTVDGKPLEA